ncbi:MAG: hypothetical protein LUO89_15775, partial [Methanothrix sp.]|nr:hypothetical protein [Methanothrix sp.]
AKLICKGLPIIDARIQATISDIQEKANKICQLTRGKNSAYEALSRELSDAAGSLSSHELVQMLKSSNRIVSQLKGLCKILPEGKRELTCDAIKEIELAATPPERLVKIELALAYALPAVEENMGARHEFDEFKKELAEEIGQFRNHLLEHMDLNQKEEIEIILKALQESRPQEEQFADLLGCMMQLISQLNELKISDETQRENWEMIAEALNNPKKDDKEKLELIIPFIPGFLQYKAVIDLLEGIRLKNLYEKIAGISKSGKIFAIKYQ